MEIIGLLILLVGVIAFAIWNYQRRSQAWARVANRHDLDFTNGGWGGEMNLSGTLEGVEVTAFTKTESSGHGKNRKSQSFTIVIARISSTAVTGVSISREGLLQKVGKTFGGEDVPVGDAELDQAFVFRGVVDEDICALLGRDEVKRALLDGQRSHKQLEVEQDQAKIRVRGKCSSLSTLQSYLQTVCGVARAIDDAWENPRRLPAEDVQAAQPETGAAADLDDAATVFEEPAADSTSGRVEEPADLEEVGGPSEPRASASEQGHW